VSVRRAFVSCGSCRLDDYFTDPCLHVAHACAPFAVYLWIIHGTLLTDLRCKQEIREWGSINDRTNHRNLKFIAQLEKKKQLNTPPDLSSAETWMQDALKLAEEIIADGDGDLTSVGEFADVEYKVGRAFDCRLRYCRAQDRFKLLSLFCVHTSRVYLV
jgi:hypothetical protein